MEYLLVFYVFYPDNNVIFHFVEKGQDSSANIS